MKQMGKHVSYGRGAIAGLVGGIIMALVAMMATAALGMGLFAAPIMIGGILLGPGAAMAGGIGVIMTGFALHMMLSVIFGLLFAFVVDVWTHEIWITAIVLAIALWLFNYHILGAILPGAHAMAEHEPTWLAALTHLVFGVAMAFVAGVSAFRRSALA